MSAIFIKDYLLVNSRPITRNKYLFVVVYLLFLCILCYVRFFPVSKPHQVKNSGPMSFSPKNSHEIYYTLCLFC